jgi:hypothetical protein
MLADARVLLSGVKATPRIGLLWPFSSFSS